ncbi:hypothetical protein [Mobilicoccus caccae]|uniref:DUF58 domain-containing protein n=1 Tax=Mobilicoccus caccae TaxID=1859295 RepID=A0ABQ6IKW5_9MICO|nr:hypothetical protein GCM10025883_06030 [Mobilicoccus caccae]
MTALGAKHRVLLASVQDPALDRTTGDTPHGDRTGPAGSAPGGVGGDDRPVDAYEVAAAEYALARRRRTAEVLSGLGVIVLDSPPDKLPRDLCDTYLDLKARGLL